MLLMGNRPTGYDVALSFAGEQRSYVEEVAVALHDAGVKYFYDDHEKVGLWGKDLYEHLDHVYRKASKYCVMFVSSDYAHKVWTTHERRSAQARALEENEEYVLPVRFDDTELPGLRPTVSYLDGRRLTPLELAQMIVEKLGPREAEPILPHSPDRLIKAVGKDLGQKLSKRQTSQVKKAASSFFSALGRMTDPERRAVTGVLAFGCKAELPDGVHISLDLLSRMTGVPANELLDRLARVRSLNVRVVRREDSAHDDDELAVDDEDVLLSYWAASVPDFKDSTTVAYEMVQVACDHFCEDHGLSIVCALDFSHLSSATPRCDVQPGCPVW